MHKAAYRWLAQHGSHYPIRALDLGGRDVNGSRRGLDVHALWPAAEWTVVDREPGPRVTAVANAATWLPDGGYGLVLCTEVAEHTPLWPAVLTTAARAGGTLLFTAATARRRPHAAVGGPLRPGEFYEGVRPDLVEAVLRDLYRHVVMHTARDGLDVRAVAKETR